MSNLADKLKLYNNSLPTNQPAQNKPLTSLAGLPNLTELPDFKPVDSGLYLRQTYHRLKQNHTNLPYRALELPTAVMGLLDLADNDLPSGEVLFLDTETTGLSISTGTIPFLIGLAWFEENQLIIQQYFLSSPGGEQALVRELDSLFKRFAYLCTFNGKSYDLPLIKNRFALQRSTMKVFAHHFDLLHIWKRLLPKHHTGGFRQKNLESTLLQISRTDDIDGADIPAIYFDWVKYGVDRGLKNIVYHNELDMHGMVSLYNEAAELYQNAKTSQLSSRIRIGRILFRNHKLNEAKELLEPILSDSQLGQADQSILLMTMFQVYTKLEDLYSAANCLEKLAYLTKQPFETVLLLRFLEYKSNNYKRALYIIDQLDKIVDFTKPALSRRGATHHLLLRGQPQIQRRIQRLIQKQTTQNLKQHLTQKLTEKSAL